MDDVQIISAGDNREEKGSKLKIFFLILTLILFLAGVSGLSYYLGRKTDIVPPLVQNQTSPTQASELTRSENVQTPTPLVTQKATPTSKPTSTPTPILKTKILSSTESLDGFRSSNGGGNSTLEIRAGRNSSLVTRGFVNFDLSEIQSDSTIQSATLKLYQAKIIGNPYIAGSTLKVDHMTYGDSLDSSDYAAPALSTNFVNIGGSTALGWTEADVTGRLKDDIANARSTSQFRIHFQTEVTGGDVTGDFVYFESADNNMGTGNTPQLIIKYH